MSRCFGTYNYTIWEEKRNPFSTSKRLQPQVTKFFCSLFNSNYDVQCSVSSVPRKGPEEVKNLENSIFYLFKTQGRQTLINLCNLGCNTFPSKAILKKKLVVRKPCKTNKFFPMPHGHTDYLIFSLLNRREVQLTNLIWSKFLPFS